MLNTHILKDYEERRYPSVNQACTEVKYKMPEQEEVVEDSDEGTFEKVMDWFESSIKNMNKTKNETDTKLYTNMNTEMKLTKYSSGVNEKGQEMEMTLPLMSTMKKKVGYINWTGLAVLTYIIPMS